MIILEKTAEVLFNYLRDVIYDPAKAVLDIEQLPEEFQDFGHGLRYFADCVMETKNLAMALSRGDLNAKAPSRGNEIAAPLKSLHATLKHLTWQTQQIARGDYRQNVDFMGDFSEAFNKMVEQLAERQSRLEIQAYRDIATDLFNRAYGMLTLDNWLAEGKRFALVFADLDSLKFVNDEFGHAEGDIYILNAARYLKSFSEDAVVCRIGGDEFMLLAPEISRADAEAKMREIYDKLKSDEYLIGKEYTYSISYGVSESGPGVLASEMLSVSDERMYEDKRANKKSRQSR